MTLCDTEEESVYFKTSRQNESLFPTCGAQIYKARGVGAGVRGMAGVVLKITAAESASPAGLG